MQQAISLYCNCDEQYPVRLRALAKPPEKLFYRGDLNITGPSAALVGTHTATPERIKTAYALGKWLAQHQVTVVSGLARGIDTGGHAGCLAGGGKTVAVLGCGLGRIYPPENKNLAADIARQGAVISEYEPDMPAAKWRLIARNRIIAALADVIIVIEPRFNQSGKMEVMEQGKKLGKSIIIIGNLSDGHYLEITQVAILDAYTYLERWLKSTYQ